MKPEDRPKVKLASLRQLASLALTPEKEQVVFRFIDTYLDLTDKEEAEFQAKLAKVSPCEVEKIANMCRV